MPATKLVYHQILDPQCQQQHLHPRVQNRDCAHTGSEFSTLRQPYTYTLDNLRTKAWTRIAVTIWGAKPRSLIVEEGWLLGPILGNPCVGFMGNPFVGFPAHFFSPLLWSAI